MTLHETVAAAVRAGRQEAEQQAADRRAREMFTGCLPVAPPDTDALITSQVVRALTTDAGPEALGEAFRAQRPDPLTVDRRDGTRRDSNTTAAAYAARVARDIHAVTGAITWWDMLLAPVTEAGASTAPGPLRAQLIEVAATASAWIKALDRRQQVLEATETIAAGIAAALECRTTVTDTGEITIDHPKLPTLPGQTAAVLVRDTKRTGPWKVPGWKWQEPLGTHLYTLDALPIATDADPQAVIDAVTQLAAATAAIHASRHVLVIGPCQRDTCAAGCSCEDPLWSDRVECPGTPGCGTWMPCKACEHDLTDREYEQVDEGVHGGVEHVWIEGVDDICVERPGLCFVQHAITECAIEDAFDRADQQVIPGRWYVDWDSDTRHLILTLTPGQRMPVPARTEETTVHA